MANCAVAIIVIYMFLRCGGLKLGEDKMRSPKLVHCKRDSSVPSIADHDVLEEQSVSSIVEQHGKRSLVTEINQKSPLRAKETCAKQSKDTPGSCSSHGDVVRVNGTMPMIAGNSEGSFCAISHTYKFIFIHVLKNAGTESKLWLRKALCGENSESDCSPLLEYGDCASMLASTYSSYLRWSWSRHIFGRAVSIYGMAKQFNMADTVSLKDFWLMGPKRWQQTGLCPDHARAQANFLMDTNGCLVVDFLGSLESAEEDMAKVLKKLNVPALTSYFNAHGFSKPEGGNTFGSKYADSKHKSSREIVEEDVELSSYLMTEYASDVELLCLQ